MKIVTWNVNSVRARIEQVETFLRKESPDVICLQETKVKDEDFPVEIFEKMGYYIAFSGQKSYNGVAIVSKFPFKNLKKDLFDTDGQKRTMEATIENIAVINAYFPRGGERGSEKFFYKLEFFQKMKDYVLNNYSLDEFLLICGDFNVARFDTDVWDPLLLQNEPGFLKEERDALEGLIGIGLLDLFRELNPSAEHIYTWWDYRGGAFRRNYGMRIDYILSTRSLAKYAKECVVEKEWRSYNKPSDHVPLVANFELSEI